MPEELHTHLPPGTKIDHFILDEVIGTGGFSMTYLAHDEQLDRKVAIKEYFPSLAVRAADGSTVGPRSGAGQDYQAGLEKFLEEARLLAQFNHPNIVRALNVLQQNNTAYLVMEFMQGETLAQRLARVGTLPSADLKRLLNGLLAGLAEVHQRDFMHRDIKPANIYLRNDDTPVLLDFGAARYAMGERSHSMTGIVTAGYAPPEQYSTSSRNQGAWSDLYALGATIYECVSGIKPFAALDRREALIEGEPDPLEPAVELGAGHYDASLLQAIDWMLAPDWKQRPQSVAALQDVLGGRRMPPKASSQRQVDSRIGDRVSSDETIIVAKPARKRRPKRTGIAIAALLALCGFGLYWFSLEPAPIPLTALGEDSGLDPGVLPDDPNFYPLRVETVPPNATLRFTKPEIDYRPGMKLPVRRYEMEVTAKHFHPKRVSALLSKKQQSFLVELEPVLYPLTVRAAPKNAEVRLVDPASAYSPGIQLPAGRYKAEISAEGYWTKQITMQLSDVRGDFEVALERIVFPITIQTTPQDAAIEIVGVDEPYRAGMDLPLGTYQIETTARHHEPRTQTVELTEKNQQFKIELAPTLYPLVIRTEPVADRINIAGLSEPYADGLRLRAGTYEITARAGKELRGQRIVQLDDKNQTFEVKLKRGPQTGDVFRDRLKDGSSGPEMVVIPAGEFRMGDLSGGGDADEKPVHKVKIAKPFAMGRFEVTVGDFRAFVSSTDFVTDAERDVGNGCYAERRLGGGDFAYVAGRSWKKPGFDQTESHPVVCVSWNDAKAYVKWLSAQTGKQYRLPSEAEWEYAARAGSATRYSFGTDPDQLCGWGNGPDQTAGRTYRGWTVANCTDGRTYTAPVGSFKANGFGLSDTHGNVWEWAEDCWHDNYRGAPTDGSAWATGGDCSRRVLRGGSWLDGPLHLRSALRGWVNRDNRFVDWGFRLLQDF